MVIIGIDTHVATCDFFVIKKSAERLEELGFGTFLTGANGFIESVLKYKDEPTVVVIEQGPMANWIRRILRPTGVKVTVAEPRRNRWIAQDATKNDKFDAKKLASLYAGGYVKEIVQRDNRNEALLRLVLHHHDLVSQRTRIKNKLKAKFRQNGVQTKGDAVYSVKNRAQWIEKLSTSKHLQWPVET